MQFELIVYSIYNTNYNTNISIVREIFIKILDFNANSVHQKPLTSVLVIRMRAIIETIIQKQLLFEKCECLSRNRNAV